ncbi:hypothetical protein PR202_ga27675 [Eleusine coracana subsp. coracana]|uniref:KIB1-4 beta-propeller domain-containing protein n=1 Tax=Eleusine coracana subsp. coracana TaxID=191504 RepID=A0AAV5DGQ4_ELECO|nr:hypothetical protein PR202_ga27675 [Eleusine coracana subsp. coracana]
MSELLLLNPFTGEQVALPSVITIQHVKAIFDESGTIHKYQLSYYTEEKVYKAPENHTLKDLRQHFYYKAFVFPEQSTGSYIVVLIHNPHSELSFARPGDDKWTWLPPNTRYRDCAYMNSLLYVLTSVGEIHAFDLTGSTITRTVIMTQVKHYIYESMYLISAPWGDLLQVWRIVDNRNDVEHDEDEDATPLLYITHKILVYKVDMVAKELVKINSLPCHMLFLGHNLSFCLNAADHPQLEAIMPTTLMITKNWL